MSQRALDYVLLLSPNRVTVTQRFVLRVIAEHYRDRYESANLDLESLIEETSLSRRHLPRIFAALSDILEYKPGIGAGRFGAFRFPALVTNQPIKAVEIPTVKDGVKAPQSCQKDDIFEAAIRKEDLNLKPERDGRDFERVRAQRRGEGSPTSSSVEPDDDAGETSAAPESNCWSGRPGDIPRDSPTVDRVIRAFERSPVTSGKANASDRQVAQNLLEIFCPEQIEHAILLATARRMSSQIPDKVRSMAYFKEVLSEPGIAENYSNSYADYLRHVIQRSGHLNAGKPPQKAAMA